MRLLNLTLPAVLLVLACVRLAVAVTEQDPNGAPLLEGGDPNPDYKGDIGTLGEGPVVVEGTIATYAQPDPDIDLFQIQLSSRTRVSYSLRGFSGGANILLFNVPEDLLVPVDTGVFPLRGEGIVWYPVFELGAGTYYLGVGPGPTGPDPQPENDPYLCTFQPATDVGFRMTKAKVKLSEKKPDKESAKVVAEYDDPGIDPRENGLFLEILGQQRLFTPESFMEKKKKLLFKGEKGDLLRKLTIDPVKKRVTVVLKKGDIGAPGLLETIDITIEAAGSRYADSVTEPTIKKNGQRLTYKAPK
jgi:hypothetical protein